MTWSKLEITQVGVCPAVWTMLENHLHLCKWSESGKLESFCMNWNIDGNKNSFKLICFLVLGFQVFKANPLDPWQLSAQQPWLQVDGSWEGPPREALHVQNFVHVWSGIQTQRKGSIMPPPADRMDQWTGKDVCGFLHPRSNEDVHWPRWEQTIWWWHLAEGPEAHSWWVNLACFCILNNLLDWFLEKCNQSILRLMWRHVAFPSHFFPARDYTSELTSILLVKEPQFQAHFTEIWTLRHASSF